MGDSNVLIVDACGASYCEHFDALHRWLSLCVREVRYFRLPGLPSSAHRRPPAQITILHAPPGTTDLRTLRHELFPETELIAFAHTGHRQCVPPAALKAVCGALASALGQRKVFELLPGVVGCSRALSKAVTDVELVAGSDAVCLLQGETGTGKELFARAVHYHGARAHQPFVAVNCGAVPDQLFENEMFGHRGGAYTDARTQAMGLLACAEGGTIFLDEVDCLSLAAQVKLLRVLQEREYRRVGSTEVITTNVRVIAASNSDLRELVKQRLFREDLFHRLNVLRVFIPPLREREGDLPLLAQSFMTGFAERYKRTAPALTDDAYDALEQYAWPGNVRELQSVIERAVLLSYSGRISASDLELPIPPARPNERIGMARAKHRVMEDFERNYVQDLLARCAGNVSEAARLAGKERRSFQRLMRKYNLVGEDFRQARPRSS